MQIFHHNDLLTDIFEEVPTSVGPQYLQACRIDLKMFIIFSGEISKEEKSGDIRR